MLINSKNLHNLPVQTESGEKLGRVSSFDVDVDVYSLRKIYVSSSLLVQIFTSSKELLIDQSQIISITAEKIIVENNVSKQAERTSLTEKVKEKLQNLGQNPLQQPMPMAKI